ncbi:MAG: phosphodiester glycosidase family protein [Clostridia bacterium]|nr:phosphodiester glycosidase family protein [Clostridia bacterium]
MNKRKSIKTKDEAKSGSLRKIGKLAGRVLAFIFVTLLLVIVSLYGVMWVIMKGPSPSAQKLFTLSVRETSAVGFLANLYLTDDEIAAIVNENSAAASSETTNASLITISEEGQSSDNGTAATDSEDSKDGIKIEEIKGSTFKGFMMIVDDPLRLFVGTPGGFGSGYEGITLEKMIESAGAVGGINAGGFYDPGGGGNGGIPDGLVICEGKLVWGDMGTPSSVIGFDSKGILHVGTMTAKQALDADVQWAVSFGPTLIVNGTPCGGMSSGVNPRTAIGQRADGAVLLLVVDGRQVDSLGATFDDLANIMLDYGAVNAANLDGGSSTLMIYNDQILNVCASISGPREIPTSFLIR